MDILYKVVYERLGEEKSRKSAILTKTACKRIRKIPWIKIRKVHQIKKGIPQWALE